MQACPPIGHETPGVIANPCTSSAGAQRVVLHGRRAWQQEPRQREDTALQLKSGVRQWPAASARRSGVLVAYLCSRLLTGAGVGRKSGEKRVVRRKLALW